MAAYEWVALDLSSGSLDIPPGAVAAGSEHGRPTYVGRVVHNGSWEVGKLNVWAKFGTPYYGKEYETTTGEVLIAKGNHTGVWVNSAFGEHVDCVTSRGPETQYVARAWHQGRWVPGKVVPSLHMMFFPFGGRELSTRKYQVLSTDFVWQEVSPEGQFPSASVPVDPSDTRRGRQNFIEGFLPAELECSPTHASREQPAQDSWTFALCRRSAEECNWVVSGDGDHERHAVTLADGRQIARAWHEADGVAGWVPCAVTPKTQSQSRWGAIYNDTFRYTDYQVLTAAPSKGASRLLCLSTSLDTIKAAETQPSPPEDIFMVTKLESGEHPWTTVAAMVAEVKGRPGSAGMSQGVRDHLCPMMPLIEHLSAEELGTLVPPQPAASATLI